MDAVIEGCIQKDHVWLVFHLKHCPYWKALQQELGASQQPLIGVCIDETHDETVACKTALARLTGLATTPCVYYRGTFVGDSQAAIALLHSLGQTGAPLEPPPAGAGHQNHRPAWDRHSAWLRTPERRWR